jgi:hypothetical protein
MCQSGVDEVVVRQAAFTTARELLRMSGVLQGSG